MIAAILLDRLAQLGVAIRLDGEDVQVRPREVIDDVLLAACKEHRREIAALLRRREIEASGPFSPGSMLCARCGRLSRVAEINHPQARCTPRSASPSARRPSSRGAKAYERDASASADGRRVMPKGGSYHAS